MTFKVIKTVYSDTQRFPFAIFLLVPIGYVHFSLLEEHRKFFENLFNIEMEQKKTAATVS